MLVSTIRSPISVHASFGCAVSAQVLQLLHPVLQPPQLANGNGAAVAAHMLAGTQPGPHCPYAIA